MNNEWEDEVQIRRGTPGCVIMLLDQSGSMADPWRGPALGRPWFSAKNGSKAAHLADIANIVLREILSNCRLKLDLVPRVYVVVFGYGGFGTKLYCDGWPADLEKNKQTLDRGSADDPRELDMGWVTPSSSGGTPMAQGLQSAEGAVDSWFKLKDTNFEKPEDRFNPQDCVPPIVLNITDGQATEFQEELDKKAAGESLTLGEKLDGATDATEIENILRTARNPTFQAVSELRRHGSKHGSVMLYNIQMSDKSGNPKEFPVNGVGMDRFEKFMLGLSSPAPEWMRKRAERFSLQLAPQSRLLILNATPASLPKLIKFGSIAD